MSFQVINLRPLQSGGNGDVSVGERSDTGETVVVKFLRDHHVAHARRAFEREVRILGRNLRGMVPLLSSNTNAERPFYVMPYFAGGAVTQYRARLFDSQILAVAGEVALTLAALHDARIWHGDVKPDNVLVSQDGRLQVGDPLGNGIGCTVLFSINRGGTPGYWAPEVRAGGQISRAGDVYSYGATLYELLTGHKPEDGRPVDPTAEGHSNVPKIREVIAACCQLDPGARPTMREVLRILGGDEWANIQAVRKQLQENLTTVCVVGGIALIVAALSSSRYSSAH